MRPFVLPLASKCCAALCAVFAPAALLAGPPAPPGWAVAEGPSGATYTHASNTAIIMLRQLPVEAAQNTDIIAAMDRPELCQGLSKAQFETRAGGTVRRVTSQSATMRCVMVFEKSSVKNVIILAMAQVGSKANPDGALQAILDAVVQDTPPTVPGAPKTIASTPRSSAAPLSAGKLPVGKLARAAYPIGLVGMWRSDWVENQYRAFTGLTLVALNNTLIFTPGGYFFNGVPDGTSLDDAGAVKMIRKDPANAGRYSYAGGVITLSYADGQKETVAAKKDGQSWQLIFRGRPMSPKMTFMSGGFLTGEYSTQRITDAGGIFVVGADDYSFAPDGRFAKGGSVSMSSAAVSSIGGRNVRGGRYVIKGSALTLSYDDGETEVYSMFQETAGENIWLNGQMYTPQ